MRKMLKNITAVVASILLVCLGQSSARADIYSDPFTVTDYSAFMPSGYYINVFGTNMLGVTTVKVGTQTVTEIYKSSTSLTFNPGTLPSGSYEFTLSNNSSTSITKPFEIFYAPIFGVASPLTGDKKGGTLVSIPGTNFCSDNLKDSVVTISWGTLDIPASYTCSEISFSVPAVKQAQPATFTARVSVSSKQGYTAPKYGTTFSFSTSVNFTYTSGNSTTNTAIPNISAIVSSGSAPGTCVLTIKGSGLTPNVFYSGQAYAYSGLGLITSTSAGYSSTDKKGQLTLTSPALIASLWGSTSGNTIIASFSDFSTGKSWTAVAKNQC
jgi:hypothetical protein